MYTMLDNEVQQLWKAAIKNKENVLTKWRRDTGIKIKQKSSTTFWQRSLRRERWGRRLTDTHAKDRRTKQEKQTMNSKFFFRLSSGLVSVLLLLLFHSWQTKLSKRHSVFCIRVLSSFGEYGFLALYRLLFLIRSHSLPPHTPLAFVLVVRLFVLFCFVVVFERVATF